MQVRRAFLLAAAPLLVAPVLAAAHPFEAFEGRWRGRAGIQVQSMTPELRSHFGAPEDRGILVTRVREDGPAHGAGVRVGDVLVAVDEQPLHEPHALVRTIARVPEGGSVELELVRDKKRRTLTVKLEGEPGPWWEREDWGSMRDRFERLLPPDRGRLDELERRLRELERRLEEYLEQRKLGDATRT